MTDPSITSQSAFKIGLDLISARVRMLLSSKMAYIALLLDQT